MNRNLWLENLASFIVEANRKTWAAEGAEVTPQRPGYKELEYSNGLWKLRDSYTGYFRAPGMTTVYFKDRPAWAMMYGGKGQEEDEYAIKLVKPTFTFLKKALMQVDPKMPIRGPQDFVDSGWYYAFELLNGRDITDFLGEERIRYAEYYGGESTLFKQTVMGGIIIGKDAQRNPVHPWEF